MSVRFKATFPTQEALNAAVATEAVPSIQLISQKHNALSFDAIDPPEWLEKEYSATIVADHKYDMELDDPFRPEFLLPDMPSHPSLDEVLAKIDAAAAWNYLGTKGSNSPLTKSALVDSV